jgi:hypothetical protein
MDAIVEDVLIAATESRAFADARHRAGPEGQSGNNPLPTRPAHGPGLGCRLIRDVLQL